MKRIAVLLISTLLLCSCEDESKYDSTPIAHDDYARIQLESDLCKHFVHEYSCLKHLKSRIV